MKQIERFHGHLGPYAVIGYKMGEKANKLLGSDPFSKSAVVWAGSTPPMSCIIDGIQLSSGCTLGKGNLSVNSDGKQIEIILRSNVMHEIDTKVTEKNMASFSEQLYRRSDQELFEISLDGHE